MKKHSMIILAALLLMSAQAQGNQKSSDSLDGARLPDFKQIVGSAFPGAVEVQELPHDPLHRGGTTLMGLVSRFLGDGLRQPWEGLNTRRYIYRAFDDKKELLGLVHGSSLPLQDKTLEAFVYYSPEARILQLQVQGLNPELYAALDKGGYLKQFEGASISDFEVTRGRKGRITAMPKFFQKLKRPPSGPLAAAFDQILRSVRFNAAFMEVAYFIGQHP